MDKLENLRVVSVYHDFYVHGGAQDVLFQIANKFNRVGKKIVLTGTDLNQITPEYKDCAIYKKFNYSNVKKLVNDNTLFISHCRRHLLPLMLMKLWFGKRMHLIHIQHSTFNTLSFLSLYPKKNIAVSKAVRDNMIDYFKIKPKHIHVIYNGLADSYKKGNETKDDNINIILIGRLEVVKQQVEIVRQTKGKLANHIRIYFAGNGEDKERLLQEIGGDEHYKLLGFVNVREVLNMYDYVMLFSQKEGLGLTLIEGCMHGKPLITNTVPAVCEINENGVNGYVFESFDELTRGINQLPFRDSDEYLCMSRKSRLKYESLFTERGMLEEYERVIREEFSN